MTRRPGSVPPPPPEIRAEMEIAGRDNDQPRLGLLHAQYRGWLADHGYPTARPSGSQRPDEADR